MVKRAAAAAAMIGFSLLAPAQAQTPSVPTDACVSAEHRAFDFWAGEWDAYRTGTDTLAGRSTIALEDHGCVLTEHWRSAGVPYSGRSLNMFDARDGRWHQVWMDSTGDITRFSGGLNAQGEMVLVAEADVGPGAEQPHWRRMTFTRNPDGSVRQHGEASPDGSAWTTSYDFTYRRRGG